VLKLGRNKTTLLWDALLSGQTSDVEALLAQSPSAAQAEVPKRLARRDEMIPFGATPLHLTAIRGQAELTRRLVQFGAQVDAPDDEGRTPLHCAAAAGQNEIAKLLLRRDASVTVIDAYGQTSLHAAGCGGADDAAQAMIHAGADLLTADNYGNTPLHCAVSGACEETVRLLLKKRVPVDVRNERQRTPLHVAVISEDHSVYSHIDPDRLDCRHCIERIAGQLLEHGADPNAVDNTGSTPLDLFEFLEGNRDDDPLVQQLVAYGGQWFRYKHRHDDDPGASKFGTRHGAPVATERAPAPTPREPASREPVGTPIQLSQRPVLIGRSRDCDVRYRSRTLSRHHACIRYEGGSYVIQDEGSRNGIVINGEKVGESHVLEPGDIIALGVYEFAFDGDSLAPLTAELSDEQLAAEGLK